MKAEIQNFHTWINVTKPDDLYRDFETMLLDAGFHVLGHIEHHFSPQGYTCLFLLAESHFAIHTFPEAGKTYIELSSCNAAKYNKFKILLRTKH